MLIDSDELKDDEERDDEDDDEDDEDVNIDDEDEDEDEDWFLIIWKVSVVAGPAGQLSELELTELSV